jgi:hypothetical protein
MPKAATKTTTKAAPATPYKKPATAPKATPKATPKPVSKPTPKASTTEDKKYVYCALLEGLSAHEGGGGVWSEWVSNPSLLNLELPA